MSIADDHERYMLSLINAARADVGADPLHLEVNLNLAAERHSLWMLETGQFSHQGVNASAPSDRMEDAGFDFVPTWRAAENIAVQSERGALGIMDDVYDLHVSLMNSSGHRKNILDPDLDYIGLGIELGDFDFESGTYASVIVTQNFATTAGIADLDTGLPDDTPPRATKGDDILVGTDNADTLRGLAGDDILNGAGGNDTLFGNDGADRLLGGNGVDSLEAGRGNDIANGEAGNDRINGGWGNDKLYGAAGNDLLVGNRGDDSLWGGNGADDLRAGAGQDRLDGGRGNDTLLGGSAADTFVFMRGGDSDRIVDFTLTVDEIDLSAFGFDTVQAALDAAGQVGAHVVFAFGNGDVLTVEHTDIGQLGGDLII